MARTPIHRNETNPPFNTFEGFIAGLLAGGASFVPLLVFEVSDRWGDLQLLDWLLDRPPLAAAYVAAAVVVPVAVAARYQPHVAVWVGIGVIVAYPTGVAIVATLWWNSVGGGSGFFG